MLAGIAALVLAAPAEARADYCEGEDAPITEATADSAGLMQLCLLNVHRDRQRARRRSPSTRRWRARPRSAQPLDGGQRRRSATTPIPRRSPPVPCDGSPDSRAAAAGYPFPTGENIAWTERARLQLAPPVRDLAQQPGAQREHAVRRLRHRRRRPRDRRPRGDRDPALRHRAQRRHRDRASTSCARRLPRCRRPRRERGRSKLAKARKRLRKADPGAERRRAKRKLRRVKAARSPRRVRPRRTQCHPTTYAGSSLSPPG